MDTPCRYPLAYAQHIRSLVDVVGVEHICIGTDTKIAVPANASEPFGSKTNKAWTTQTEGFFYSVVEAMLNSGFNEDEISKIGGENYCRIFDQATKR
ncbi:membrane dipeptidase [Rhodocytophaga rosea]|uniref:membrane dipeptidase n=1 Tax=Rhodocytophaga rosea TaxID=2704465 RepID=UPI0018D8F64C